MPDIIILNRETLSDGKYLLEKVGYTFTDNEVREHTAEREVYHRSASASILLYDPTRNTILLSLQSRLPVYMRETQTSYLLEACAGMIDDGELPEECIIREVEEELGYRISEIDKIAEAYLSPGSTTEYMHFFIGEYSPEMKVGDGGGLKKEGEDLRAIELSFSEARQKLSEGKIHDTKTLILLQYALINHII